MTVMIVDDNKRIREIIKNTLSITELMIDRIFECEDGFNALKMYESCNPDLVLMDIKMKNINGFKASEQLRMLNQDVKIIFVTQYDDDAFKERAKKLGVKAYVLKENLTDLPGIIRSLL